jgi:thioredoxin 1
MENEINTPVQVTDADFNEKVLQSRIPVIVDFWAPWCGPCRMVAPFLESIAKDFAGKLIVAKVNTDENSARAIEYQVRGIPTMLMISMGQMVWKQVGALPEKKLRETITQMLEKSNN